MIPPSIPDSDLPSGIPTPREVLEDDPYPHGDAGEIIDVPLDAPVYKTESEVKEDKIIELEKGVELKEAKSVLSDRPEIARPPGLLGEIAEYVYRISPQPSYAGSLAAALGLLAAITGRAYNVNGAGLNLYMLLLAGTGMGKAGLVDGISYLMNAVERKLPAANEFIGPEYAASYPALAKALEMSPSCVSIIDEFGKRMKELNVSSNSQAEGLKKAYLALYSASGANKRWGGMKYSDSKNDVPVIRSPAWSVIGVTVPEEFYEALSDSMVTNGFVPRFLLLDHHGKKQKVRMGIDRSVPDKLTESVSALMLKCLTLNSTDDVIDVKIAEDAYSLLSDFEDETLDHQNEGSDLVSRQLWNRSYENSLKVAALMAVSENPYAPVIDAKMAEWSVHIVRYSAVTVEKAYKSGKFGGSNNEKAQYDALKDVLKRYLLRASKPSEKSVDRQLRKDFVIRYTTLQNYGMSRAVFKQDRMGPSYAVRRAISMLEDAGIVEKMHVREGTKAYGIRAKLLRIVGVEEVFDD